MAELLHKKKRLTPFQIIIIGFAGVIFIGAVLLMLPISSKEGIFTPFNEALFTSTSAVCVTGLVVHDTASYWSFFGQSVILALIQIGGLGVITVAAAFTLFSKHKFSLMQRSTIKEALSAHKVGGVVRLIIFVLKATLIIEVAGAVALMPTFVGQFGADGIWMSFFHSISAFCNAGFDVMGVYDVQFASFTSYAAEPSVNITVMLLIIIGGIGFLTWEDIYTHKFRVRQYKMQTKVILLTTALLIIIPAIFFFFVDFAHLPMQQRVYSSFFQSVAPRTAGFNTADLNAMTGAGQAIIIVLMLIGGSPGSTAGGIKTTTFAVLAANAFSVFRKKQSPEMFRRRIEPDAVRSAATVLMMYLALFFTGAVVISIAEGLPFDVCLYETASAIGTVGLSLGITPELGILSQSVLMLLMFFGRVGGLTLIYMALSGNGKNISRLPQEKITVG